LLRLAIGDDEVLLAGNVDVVGVAVRVPKQVVLKAVLDNNRS
jgi:hypothetical protein